MFKPKRAIAIICTLMLVTMLFHPVALASVEKDGNSLIVQQTKSAHSL